MAHGVEVWPEGDSSPKSKLQEKKKAVREGKGAGSRRIFSPQFKLQVLDSYRKDKDCRGNQRATARKYGIHRRQIQKWLQMESTLRCNAGSALNLARQRDVVDDDGSGRTTEAGCLSPSVQEPERPIDVDKVSDSEGESSDASYDQDQALDFTCAALSKRRFFTVSFKLEVLEAFKSDPSCRGNQRATARKFGVHRRQVQKWLDHESQLRCEPMVDNSERSECCLDLSKKRPFPEASPPQPAAAAVVPSPQALCLVKPESPPDLYRPYNLSSTPPSTISSPANLSPSNPPSFDPWPTYYPYYNIVHTSYLSPWIPPTPPDYYKQPIPSFNLYTPMYSS